MGDATGEVMGAGTSDRPLEELNAALPHLRAAPRDFGRVEMLVRRPGVDRREVQETLEFDTTVGVVGDDWKARGSRSTPDGAARPEAQVTLMNARAAAAIAGERRFWPITGDQVYVDLDLSLENLPAGARLAVGTAVLEVSELPHTGCAKFAARFGHAALRFVNTADGRRLNLRGVNARVIQGGAVSLGDLITRL